MLRAMGVYWDARSTGEIGTKAIYALALMIGDDPRIFLVLASGLAVALYITSIRRTAILPASGLFVFISFGFYLFHFNGLRQGLAMGFFMMALHHVVTGNFRRYLLWGTAAGFFHATAFFALPVYFLVRRGLTAFNVLALVVGSVVLVFLLGPILELLGAVNPRYSAYADRTETGGMLITIFYIGVSVLFISMRRWVDSRLLSSYDIFLMLLLLGTSIFGVVTLTGSYVELTRMALYLTVSMVFIVPILIFSAKSMGKRISVYVALLYGGCGYYYVFLGQIGGYVPYVLWS